MNHSTLFRTRNNLIRTFVGVILVFLSGSAAVGATGTWNVDANGNWTIAGNWSGGVPSAAGDTANLTFNITAARTVTLDSGETVGTLTVGDSGSTFNGYTLSGAQTLTFNNSGNGAKLLQPTAASVTDAINLTSIALADNLLVSNVNTLTLQQLITGAGGTYSLTKGGPGILAVQLNMNSTYTGGTIVTNGSLYLGYSTGQIPGGGTYGTLGTGSITISNGATLLGGYVKSTANTYTLTNAITVGAGGGKILAFDGNSTFSGPIAINGATTMGANFGGKYLTLSGPISGSSGLTLAVNTLDSGHTYDGSYVSFTGAGGTYSGTITVPPMTSGNGSYLFVGNSTALTNATINLSGNNSGGGNSASGVNSYVNTLQFTVTSATIGGLSGSGNFALLKTDNSTPVALSIGSTNANTTYTGVMSGGGNLTKVGTNALTLNAAQSYSGGTVVSAGTLALGANGSFANTPSITVSNGASLDVSAVPGFTLGGTQILYGSGTNYGSVNTTAGSKIYAGLDAGGYATNVFNNNLTNVSGAIIFMDVGDSATQTNDQIRVIGTLALNNTTFRIKAPSISDSLDQTTDYVLCTAANIVGTPNSSPTWDVQPANYANFIVTTNAANTQVVLHYNANTPLSGSGFASPSSLVHNQTTTLTVSVTPATGPASTGIAVTVDASPLGGSGALSLVLSNNNVYTNSLIVGSAVSFGTKTLTATITDAQSRSATPTISAIVSANTVTWNGGGSDNNLSSGANWVAGISPGTVGDSLIFSGSTRPAPSLEANYDVAALTFDSAATTSFTLGSATGTLTLSGGLTNNSANGQTLNVPVALNGSQTINSSTGSLTLNSPVSGNGAVLTKAGINALTMGSGANNYSGGTVLNAGTLILGADNCLGVNSVDFSGPGLRILDLNGHTLTNTLTETTLTDGLNVINSNIGATATNAGAFNIAFTRDTFWTNGGVGNIWWSGNFNRNSGSTAFYLYKIGAGTVTMNASGSGAIWNLLANGGTVELAATGTGTVADNVTANSGATVRYHSTLTTMPSSGYSGQLGLGLFINGGTVDLNGSSGVNSYIQTLSGTAGGLLTNSSFTPAVLTLRPNFRSGTYVSAQNIRGNLSLSFQRNAGSSIVYQFTGTNDFTGTNTISDGAVWLRSSAASVNAWYVINTDFGLRFSSDTSFTVGALSGANKLSLTNDSGTPVALSIGANNADSTFSGVISDSGGLTKIGNGTLTLSGSSTYAGGTVVNGGTLALATGGGAGAVRGSLTINSGATVNLMATDALGYNNDSTRVTALNINGGTLNNMTNGNQGYRTSFVLTGGVVGSPSNGMFNFTTGQVISNLASSTMSSITAPVQLRDGAVLTIDVAAGTVPSGTDLAMSGAVSQSGAAAGIIKTGIGKLILSGANTYNGDTVINAGTLAFSGGGAIANSANIIISGATFDVSALPSTFTLGSGKVLIATNGATGTVAGNINLGIGSLVLNYTNGTPSLQTINGTFTFNSNAVTVTVSGAALSVGSYKLISTNAGGAIAGTLPVSATVNGAGTVSGTVGLLKVLGGELYLVVDHPPVANPLNVTRTAGLSLKIPWTNILAAWSDADSDPVSLNTFSLITTNGVTLFTNATWIFYTNNLNVADQFSYTIADSLGATSAGIVNIVVNPFVTGQGSTVIVSGNSANITFFGISGYSYITQRATNIDAPNWVDIATNAVSSSGAISITDSFSDLGGSVPDAAYYRLKWQP